MKNFRGILLQIMDVIDIHPWKEGEIEDFLVITELEAMFDLIEALPKEKQGPMIDQMKSILNMENAPWDIERMFARYYTRAQMQEAVITRTKKSIAKDVVEPHRKALSLDQQESIRALLNKLTYLEGRDW